MKNNSIDIHYTSTSLARSLVSLASNDQPSSIVDFCVGGGELLRAAEERFPCSRFYGFDISYDAIKILCHNHPNWEVNTSDFLSLDSRSEKIADGKKFELVLLNPPFTCKGNSFHVIEYEDSSYKVSTALCFLIHSLTYLEQRGELLAIMPVSSIYSQKDKDAWSALCKNYKIEIVEEFEKQYFKQCAPNVVILRISRGITVRLHNLKVVNHNFRGRLKIQRGTLSLCKQPASADEGTPYIHTTSLRNNQILRPISHFKSNTSLVKGPCVLLQRVGKPQKGKLCLIAKGEEYIISDCLIALKTQTFKDAKLLYGILFDEWEKFSTMYKGTGAKYITIEKIRNFIETGNLF